MGILFGIIVFFIIPSILLMQILWHTYLEYRSDRIPILLYHRFISKKAAERGDIRDDEIIYVTYDTVFEKQMTYLKQAGYTTLDLDDYLRIRNGEIKIPSNPVIITFDDGYMSNYTIAFPVLKKNAFKATIFVALEPDNYTRNLVEGIDSFLTSEQMQEMLKNNISIQSHTLTHCFLTELDNETVLFELNESRRRLEELLGYPVNHIAIPRAGYSRRIKTLVAKSCFKTVCCNNKGSTTGLTDPLALARIVIERDMNLDDFAKSLQPSSAIMLRVVGNIKRIPEMGGARVAQIVRNYLYKKPFLPIFQTQNLKKIILAFTVVYFFCGVLFFMYIMGY